jgi:hypothetical protein
MPTAMMATPTTLFIKLPLSVSGQKAPVETMVYEACGVLKRAGIAPLSEGRRFLPPGCGSRPLGGWTLLTVAVTPHFAWRASPPYWPRCGRHRRRSWSSCTAGLGNDRSGSAGRAVQPDRRGNAAERPVL